MWQGNNIQHLVWSRVCRVSCCQSFKHVNMLSLIDKHRRRECLIRKMEVLVASGFKVEGPKQYLEELNLRHRVQCNSISFFHGLSANIVSKTWPGWASRLDRWSVSKNWALKIYAGRASWSIPRAQYESCTPGVPIRKASNRARKGVILEKWPH